MNVKSLRERINDLDVNVIQPVTPLKSYHKSMEKVALRVVEAKKNKNSIIMIIGGHVIRSVVQRYIIYLLEKGYISCLSMNGSCIIHDFELSLIGATTENVARYIKEGQFGLWEETGQINEIVNRAYKNGGMGMGKAIGKAIYEGDFPHKEISLLAACYRLNIPSTVHVGIGYDITHQHSNFDGAAAGSLSYMDFLQFTKIVSNLEGGVIMNFGSSVMAPEVFLKALSMARNVAHQQGKFIKHFTTLVCDLHELPDDFNKEPPKDSPAYYFRPWKTMLIRTVNDGGKSYYIKGKHSETVPALWSAINIEEEKMRN
tara:strand:+ start:4461 stop:5405 length:945 start_codon:yes stop_codon:yes gene_type:complete